MTTIERCQLRNCVYFVVINDGNNFFAETQFLAKSTEVFKSHSKTVDKIDLCGNFWFCFGKIELFCRIPFERYKVKKYDAISSVCVCIKSCVFERKPSSILNAWIHPHINVDDESKSQQLNRERRRAKTVCEIDEMDSWNATSHWNMYYVTHLWAFGCVDFWISNFENVYIKFNCYQKSLEPFST